MASVPWPRRLRRWYRGLPHRRQRLLDYAVYLAVGAVMLAFIAILAECATHEQGVAVFDWIRLAAGTAIGFGYAAGGTPRQARTKRFWIFWVALLSLHAAVFSLGMIQGSGWARVQPWLLAPALIVVVSGVLTLVRTRFPG